MESLNTLKVLSLLFSRGEFRGQNSSFSAAILLLFYLPNLKQQQQRKKFEYQRIRKIVFISSLAKV